MHSDFQAFEDQAIAADSQYIPVRDKGVRDHTRTKLPVVNAATYLNTEPPTPDQVINNILDVGDKAAIIGSSKVRKSFFAVSTALSLASGRSFNSLEIDQRRSVLYVQFEIREGHMHKRLNRIAAAMGISAQHVEDRLKIVNARGLGLGGTKGVERITDLALNLRSEVIFLDPLYKLADGIENAAEDMKLIMNAFDTLAEKANAAVIYIHHDPKGSPGDRDIRDRGAGSNVIGRDYDACITLTAHATEDDAVVIDTLLRNYAPQQPFVIAWEDYRFVERGDMLPEKRTTATPKTDTPIPAYLPIAQEVLEHGSLNIAVFKAMFKEKSGITDKKMGAFIKWAEDDRLLVTDWRRGRGLNDKRIGLPGAFDDEQS